jgi:DNA repair protein RecO (recombination protein O)
MLKRTEAIVLKTTPFAEADLIVTALTLDYGIVKTFAKSPRKTKSRFGSSLEPLTHSNISFWGREDAELPRLTQSDIIRSFQSIRDRMECFFGVMEIAELTLSLLPEREPNKDVFGLLISILGRIDERSAGSDVLDTLLYRIRFLDMTGYGPRLEGCARCGRAGYNFYIAHGSVICGVCAENTDAPIRLSPGLMRLYETMRKWDIRKIDRIKPSRTLLSELMAVLDTHILHTLAKPLKTKSFSVGD